MAHRVAVYGASLALESGFDAKRGAEVLGEGTVTHASLVPTTLERVLDVARGSFARVEAVLVGGGPMTPALLRRARVGAAGVAETWG